MKISIVDLKVLLKEINVVLNSTDEDTAELAIHLISLKDEIEYLIDSYFDG